VILDLDHTLWDWTHAWGAATRAMVRVLVAASVDPLLGPAIDPRPFYTHAFPLQDIDRALDAAASRPAGFLTALVTM
jgi:hypothetical protein